MLYHDIIDTTKKGDSKKLLILLNKLEECQLEQEMYISMLWAIITNNTKIIKMILKLGININNTYYRGHVLLSTAIRENKVKIAKQFIKLGANPNLKDKSGKTPLHYAVFNKTNDNIKLVKILLKAGSNPNEKDLKGKSALDYAKDFKRNEIIYFINKINLSKIKNVT